MDENVVKTCVIRNNEKHFENLKKSSYCKVCNIKKVLKWYSNIKDESLQKRRDKYARFKDLRFRLKALEEELSNFNLTTWIVMYKIMNVFEISILWTINYSESNQFY